MEITPRMAAQKAKNDRICREYVRVQMLGGKHYVPPYMEHEVRP